MERESWNNRGVNQSAIQNDSNCSLCVSIALQICSSANIKGNVQIELARQLLSNSLFIFSNWLTISLFESNLCLFKTTSPALLHCKSIVDWLKDTNSQRKEDSAVSREMRNKLGSLHVLLQLFAVVFSKEIVIKNERCKVCHFLTETFEAVSFFF